MNEWGPLLSAWHWKPEVLGGCLVLVMAYLLATRGRRGWRVSLFVTGIVVLALSLVSPLDTLSHTYLFSAHMLQHLLMVLLVPPMLILGLPSSLVTELVAWRPVGRAERVLCHPLVAWTAANGVMWLWHLPVLYNAAIDHDGIHVVEHLCFLVTATIFWWPILAPVSQSRLAPLPALLYLFGAFGAMSALGIILTFVAPGLYPIYLAPPDTLGILPLLRERWGITPGVDQQLGGLLMCVTGVLAYLVAILGILGRWYSMPDDDPAPILSHS